MTPAPARGPGRVLIVAGSDPGGGAGIQADIKTVTALGGYAMAAITALTAQNSRGVHGVHAVPPAFVAEQIDRVLEDFGADCIKLGMLHRAEVIDAVADALSRHGAGIPIVLDPVMVAKGGHSLLADEAVMALRRRLIGLSALITPNLPEAAVLAGEEIEPQPLRAEGRLATALLALGPEAVLVKGGHATGAVVTDVLARRGREPAVFEGPRIETRHTHGTGCTLASAIATGIAQGLELERAVGRARAYVADAIRTAPGLGHGHGPLNHGHTVRPYPG
jgi:hydroxymethylpyrimidine/phosphomethylpyrimidine kinase